MKTVRRKAPSGEKTNAIASGTAASEKIIEPTEQTPQEVKKETVQSTASTELRTRITNAVKVIRELGGEVGDVNQSDITDEELQAELEELTSQYKRPKRSKGK